jgi:hypothetical protein
MADIYAIVDDQRAFLSALDRVTASRMLVAYENVLRQAQKDYRGFTDRLEQWQRANPSMDPRGASPSRHWIFQQERYKALIGQLEQNTALYAKVSAGAIRDSQQAAMQKAQATNTDLIHASLGGGDMGGGRVRQ